MSVEDWIISKNPLQQFIMALGFVVIFCIVFGNILHFLVNKFSNPKSSEK